MSKLLDTIGQFVTIPHTVIRMMPQIGDEALSLFVYMRYRTNSISGDAFPSYETIKAETGLSYRKIARSIRKLETLELMTRKKRFGGSNEYTLTLPYPIPIDRPVLSTGIGKSSQRVQTIKNDSIKTDLSTVPAADFSLIAKTYENEIGFLTAMTRDLLVEASNEYPADWICDAIKESSKANVRKWNYVSAILKNWKLNGRGDHRKKEIMSGNELPLGKVL